jgi:hypothetical protein
MSAYVAVSLLASCLYALLKRPSRRNGGDAPPF